MNTSPFFLGARGRSFSAPNLYRSLTAFGCRVLRARAACALALGGNAYYTVISIKCSASATGSPTLAITSTGKYAGQTLR